MDEVGALTAGGQSRTRAAELVIERAIEDARKASTVVFVEGVSDQIALEALAARCGRELRKEGVFIVPMGGATNIGRFLTLFGPAGLSRRIGGLYDVAEEDHFRRGLERAGMGVGLDRTQIASLGFHVCVTDLEDEFIRSLTVEEVERLVEQEGELPSLRRMQRQPFHRERTREQQIHRFIGVHSGRKYQYARRFAESVELERIPKPIGELLAYL